VSHILIENFDPLKQQKVEILSADGKIVNADLNPKLDQETLIKIYKTMTLGRVADIRAVQYQRQGRMLTYAPNIGQEATQVGAMAALNKEDWLVPGYRELNMMLYKGVPLENIYLYWYGNEMGSKFPKEARVLPVNIIIGSQIAIAAGVALAAQKQNKPEVVVTTIGDGGTSHGDFNEGMNFAGTFDAPLVILIQNNHWAISTPREIQTKAKTLAQKAIAAGIKGIQVDGNDVFAVYSVMKKATEHARSGKGPVLVEAVTYRIGAHTTSDDPTLYRSDEEVEKWRKRDPIARLKKYLIAKKWWSEKEDELLDAENNKYVQEVFAKVEKSGEVPLEDVFQYVYETMTPNQIEQYESYKEFLERGMK
jgi:pyruvate dehydrogenase E1 component alpha subunit